MVAILGGGQATDDLDALRKHHVGSCFRQDQIHRIKASEREIQFLLLMP